MTVSQKLDIEKLKSIKISELNKIAREMNVNGVSS